MRHIAEVVGVCEKSAYPGVTFRDSTLNTANLCPVVSVVGLFYLLTVMYTFVWFGTLVHFRWTVHSKL